jgi:hypothetical protein
MPDVSHLLWGIVVRPREPPEQTKAENEEDEHPD